MGKPGAYWSATRHPWPCLLFVLPLLAAYEGGVRVLGGAHPEALRNGADNWLRCGLAAVRLSYFWLPPALLGAAFAFWSFLRRGDRPADLVNVLNGMVLESVTYALGLWAVSRVLAPLLQRIGVELAVAVANEPTVRQVVTYLGAGIYEEALFRLVLFSGLTWLLGLAGLPVPSNAILAALASAVLF